MRGSGVVVRAAVVAGVLAGGAGVVNAVAGEGPPSVVYSSGVQADAPLGFWRLGEGKGVAVDGSGAGRNGTYAGPTASRKGALTDDGDKALKLNDNTATNAHVAVPDDGSLSLAGDLTIEAWVNTTGSAGNYQMIVTKSPGADAKFDAVPSNYELWLRPDLVPEFRETAGVGNPIVTAARPVVAKTWTHLVVTRTGNKVAFFLDGAPAGAGSTGIGEVKTNTLPVRIGSREDQGDTAYSTFRGGIDDVAIYATALAPERIALHHQAGTDPASLAPAAPEPTTAPTAAPAAPAPTDPPTTVATTPSTPAPTAAPTTPAPTVAPTVAPTPVITVATKPVDTTVAPAPGAGGPLTGAWPASPQAISAAVCDSASLNGPASAPTVAGYVNRVVTPATLASELAAYKATNGGKVLFYFTAGDYSTSQILPASGNQFVGGAPSAAYPKGAVLTPSAGTRYAFGGQASDVTLRYLTVQGFSAAWPAYDEGVVNHDSGDRWTFESNTFHDNHGAAVMIGTGNVLRGNCMRRNGQYAFNAYEAANNGHEVLMENNEIAGNNTDDMEVKVRPGCGCSGGGKFWVFADVTFRNNWVHDNVGPGLWIDGNNNGFMITNNIFERNAEEAIAYEVSYNAVISNNVIRGNMTRKVTNGTLRPRSNTFPDAAVYISDSSGASNLPNKFGITTISITGNLFDDNPNGLTLFPNLMRGCSATAWWLISDNCANLKRPLAGTDRWGVKNVTVSGNTFRYDANKAYATCQGTWCGRNSVFAQRQGIVSGSGGSVDLRESTTTDARNLLFDGTIRFANNRYIGDWRFTAIDGSCTVSADRWKAAGTPDKFSSFATANVNLQCASNPAAVGFGQDAGSTVEAFK